MWPTYAKIELLKTLQACNFWKFGEDTMKYVWS